MNSRMIGFVVRLRALLGRSLPAPARSRVKRVLTPLLRRGSRLVPGGVHTPSATSSFATNTACLAVDPGMLEWSRTSGRPVSIVIPSYNDFELLTACLASIEATCAAIDHEVIVVDDYCEPSNSERLRTLESPTVRVVFKEQRQGFAVSVNVGMALARFDIVLLNSDIVALPGWLEALQYSAYEIDERVGLVSPKLVYPNGTIQYGGTYYARVLAPQWFGHLFVGSPATRPQANVAGYNRSISGACVYLTRHAYSVLGGLDEDYWLGFEDVDYGLSAWAHGIRCYYQPAAMLVHHESASRGYSQGPREIASMRYFWRKWQNRFLARELDPSGAVDFIVSDRSSDLWREYVEQQADSLRARGREVRVLSTTTEADESSIRDLETVDSIKIACDWGASVVTWLGGVNHGSIAYLLPGVESGAFPDDEALQAWIVAQYRPEFDYIAPNRWTADQLRAETAWETTRRVVPALDPGELPHTPFMSYALTFGLPAAQRARVDGVVMRLGGAAKHLDHSSPTVADLETIRVARPRVIVALGEFDSSLAPIALMSSGSALVGRHNDKTRYEVLDGFNALLVPPDGTLELLAAVELLMTDDRALSELTTNGFETAQRLARQSRSEMLGAISSIGAVAV